MSTKAWEEIKTGIENGKEKGQNDRSQSVAVLAYCCGFAGSRPLALHMAHARFRATGQGRRPDRGGGRGRGRNVVQSPGSSRPFLQGYIDRREIAGAVAMSVRRGKIYARMRGHFA